MTNKKSNSKQVLDPFARRTASSNDIGEATSITDTQEEDAKRIESMVPSDATTEAGYQRMLEILGKTESQPVTSPVPIDEPPSIVSPVSEPSAPDTKNVFSFLNNKQKEESQPSTPPSPPLVEQQQPKDTTLNSIKEELEDKTELPPIKDEDVLPILDSILTRGYASETYFIRGARITLRSQFFWEDQMVVEMTDSRAITTNLKATSNFYFQVYALAANLVEFGGNYFKPINHGDPEDLRKSLQDRIDFLMGLPSVLVTALFDYRIKFILKLQYLNENFSKLLESF